MIEFALCIPFMLLLLMATCYFGLAFYTKQVVSMATQEGVRMASRLDLTVAQNADYVRGFTTDGQMLNENSPVYRIFSGAHLLSQGTTGNLPTGASVQVLPFDNSSIALPAGTVALQIQYPFTLLNSPLFSGNLNIWTSFTGAPVTLQNWTITEQSVAIQEVF
jgi:Flp pilus assembly protein TadG